MNPDSRPRLLAAALPLMAALTLLAPHVAEAQVIHFGSESTSDKNAYDEWIAEAEAELARLQDLKAAVRRDLEKGEYDPQTFTARSEVSGIARVLMQAGAPYQAAGAPAPASVIERKMQGYDERIRAQMGEIARLKAARLGESPPEEPDAGQEAETDPITLRADCIHALKDHDERLKLAGAAQSLLAWTPLLLLVGESNPVHLAYTIQTMPWEELGESIGAANQLAYSQLATEARIHAEKHRDDPPLHTFWLRLSASYSRKIGR